MEFDVYWEYFQPELYLTRQHFFSSSLEGFFYPIKKYAWEVGSNNLEGREMRNWLQGVAVKDQLI
jgi:hypothetical protein